MPPIPTEPVSPKPMASPWAPTASVTSAAVRPVSAPRRPALDVDVDALHVREVEHDPALADAVAGAAVAAAPDGQLEPGLAREAHDGYDVVDVGDLDDDRRPAIDRAVDDRAGLVIALVAGRDDPAVEVGAQAWDGEGRPQLGRIGGAHRGPPGRRGRVGGASPGSFLDEAPYVVGSQVVRGSSRGASCSCISRRYSSSRSSRPSQSWRYCSR